MSELPPDYPIATPAYMPTPVPPGVNPNQPGMVIVRDDPWASNALWLGVVSLFCCQVMAPVAVYIGWSARKRIRNSEGTLGGLSAATTGWILGMVGTALLLAGLVLRLVWLLLYVHGSG